MFLYKKNEEAAATTETLPQANKIAVSGTVYDDEGLPVIGANVLEEGTTNGTITDVDGKFTLRNVTPGARVNISYIGFNTHTFRARGSRWRCAYKTRHHG